MVGYPSPDRVKDGGHQATVELLSFATNEIREKYGDPESRQVALLVIIDLSDMMAFCRNRKPIREISS
jgi:hypothetical protein